jgi:nucleotide-binding universal stress UspA family protein
MKALEISTAVSIQNIAFPTDLSAESYAALPFAADFAKRYGAKIWGFHVVAPHEYGKRPYRDMPTLEKDVQATGHELALEFEKRLAGIPNEVKVLEYGETWHALSSFIKENDIDLLVMGTHGRTGLGKAMLGSVAENVFRQCQCPVLTVGPKVTHRLDQLTVPKEILYATDFTIASRAAAPYAISQAEQQGAHLVLLHVIENPKAGELAFGGEFVVAATHLLHELVPPDANLSSKPEEIVKFGAPADVILGLAQERNADLIVLGVRKPEGNLALATHFGRATAYRVVSEAKCPVLTVRG